MRIRAAQQSSPPEKLSGVIFKMPITYVRLPQSKLSFPSVSGLIIFVLLVVVWYPSDLSSEPACSHGLLDRGILSGYNFIDHEFPTMPLTLLDQDRFPQVYRKCRTRQLARAMPATRFFVLQNVLPVG